MIWIRNRSVGIALGLAIGLVAVAGPGHADEVPAGGVIVAQPERTEAQGAADPDASQERAADQEERLSRIEAGMGALAEELDSLRKIFAVPEDTGLVSFSGLGPAASKVYQRDRGLSIGGYGEVRLRVDVDDESETDTDVFDALRAIIYVGYKFNDWIVLNSEFEFEHAGSGGGGSVSTEFLTLDFLLCECFNVRAGLVLAPMGFINEIHEPVFFYGAERPEVERLIIPTTWRENGAGVFGTIADRVHYRFYGINGFDATGFSDNGLRGGRQKGSRALADHFGFVGRIDVEPTDGLHFGGSVYTGKSGQNLVGFDPGGGLPAFNVPDTLTTIWEFRGQFKRYGIHMRGLYTQAHIQDAGELSLGLFGPGGTAVAKVMKGWYVEFAYDLLPLVLPDTEMSVEPFFRYEAVDTQHEIPTGFTRNPSRDRKYRTVGIQFKPHPQVVLKLDYRNIISEGGKIPDEIQVGFGYVF